MTTNRLGHNSCATCPSRHTTEWRDLNKVELASLDHAKKTTTIAPGTNIYRQGDQPEGVFCIQSGLIGLRRLEENGSSALLKTCSGGTTAGYMAFLSKEPYSNSAEALVPSEVCFIESASVSKLLAENPKLGERFLQHSIADLKELEENYSKSLALGVKSRFLHLMMVYYQQSGFLDSGGNPLSIFQLPGSIWLKCLEYSLNLCLV